MNTAGYFKRWLCAVAFFMGLTSFAAAAGGFPQPDICARSCWGARAPKWGMVYNANLNRAVIHHTANAHEFNTTSHAQSRANVRAIQNFHMDVNGWNDIAYNFLVDRLGNRFEGRFNSIGTWVRGGADTNNVNSASFTMMGYFHSPVNQSPPAVMRNAIYDLIAWKMPDGWSPYGGAFYNGKSNVGWLCGHRNIDATACPGDLYHNVYLTNNLWGGEARNAVWDRIQGTADPDIIIDNGTSGYTESGTWGTSNASGFYGTDSRWAAVFDTPQNNTATWTFNLAESGTYEVYAWWVSGSNRSPGAAYYVNHMNGQTLSRQNQQSNGGTWNLLGEFSFQAGTNTIVLESEESWNGGNPNAVISADAVGMTRTGPLVVDVIVDNTDSGFAASSNWFESTSVPGYYGDNYHARATASVSDAAVWTATLPQDGTYKVYARWTTGSNRATAAPYIVTTSDGDVTVPVNQQQNNGQWVELGTWYLFQGTAPRVRLSCWTSSGDFVIADAVRFVLQ
ncbi:MAG: N-acetylmuramoyl-L-alanine amidase [Candidatus Sumerlaeia bacterium]|nr:N-acetylmuramoyl-L-alanine amidase [Candidatus Sumerlaeia bacterium]